MDKVCLSILASRCDTSFLRQTVSNMVAGCRYPWHERMVVYDTAPLSGKRYQNNPFISSREQLEQLLAEMVADGLIDRFVPVDYSAPLRRSILHKHFGSPNFPTHDFRGGPIYSLIYAYEAADNPDFLLHFDADIMLHCAPQFDWIAHAIDCLKANPDLLCINPLAGPPHPDGKLLQQDGFHCPYQYDDRGYHLFKEFTARRHLLHCGRFAQCLPLPRFRFSLRKQLKGLLRGKRMVWSWEGHVGNLLASSHLWRADLATPQAWTLHPHERGAAFIEHLPRLLRCVEAGLFPASQAGHYDLQFDAFCQFAKEAFPDV